MSKLVTRTIILFTLLFSSQNTYAVTPTIIINNQNTTVLGGPISPISLAAAANDVQTRYINRGASTTSYLLIYSNGGMLLGCDKFSNIISQTPGLQIIILRARSAGALISQCKNLVRLIDVDGDLVFHRVRVTIQGFVTAEDLARLAKLLEEESVEFDNQCSARLNIDSKTYRDNVYGKDWKIYADEALSVGAADKKVQVVCDSEYEKKSPLAINIEEDENAELLPICQIINNIRLNKRKTNVKTK